MSVFSVMVFAGVTLTCVAAVGFGLLAKHARQQDRRLSELKSRLDVFVDTSITVARVVDHMALNRNEVPRTTVASRRWLLAEAKQRLASGEIISDIAKPLGLSKDEMRLLRCQLH